MGNLAHKVGNGGIFGGATRALRGRLPGAFLAFAVALAACAVLSGSAQAASLTVDDLGDARDASAGNGSCADASGKCTLRAAIEEANALAGNDEIGFVQGLSGTITLTNGELSIRGSHDLTITGPGRDKLTVSGGGKSRVFAAKYWANPVTAVTISDLTIADGYSDEEDENGGGVYSEIPKLTLRNTTLRDNNATVKGGGIYVATISLSYTAQTRLENSTLSGNHAGVRTDGLFAGGGGGIYNLASDLTVRNSTLSDNTTGSSGDGGGIANEAGTVSVQNSTLSGNRGVVSGGIDNRTFTNEYTAQTYPSKLTVRNSTITNNEGFDLVNRDGSTAEVGNSIVATGGSTNDVAGAFTSLGYNLIGAVDGSSGFTNGTNGNKTGTQSAPLDPKLGPLADNGGPTRTHALLSGSPATDAGDPAFAPPPEFDQRGEGYPRTYNSRVDIGAFEAQPNELPVAQDDDYETPVGESLDVPAPGVLTNDSDPDGEAITALKASDPQDGTLTLDTDGSFTYTPDPDFVGTDSFTYKVTDGHAESSAVTARIAVLDEVPPDTRITSGTEGLGKSGSASFSFESTEDGSSFECSLDGEPFATCSSPKAYSGLPDGPHAFEVRAVDAADNADPSPAKRTFTVDTTAPSVAKTIPVNGARKVASKANVTITFSEAMNQDTLNAATVKLVKKGTTKPVAAKLSYPSAQSVLLNPNKPLKRGATYTATITTGAQDTAGNPLEENKSWSFRIRR